MCVHRLSICITPKIYSNLLSKGLNKIVFLNLVKNGVFFYFEFNFSSFVVPSPLCCMSWVWSIIHIWDLKPKKLASFPLTLLILFPTKLSSERLFPNQIFHCRTSPVGCRTFQIPGNLCRFYFVSTGSHFSLIFWKMEQKKRSYEKEMGNEV